MKIDEIDVNSEQIREILEKQPNVFLRWGISAICCVIVLMFLTTWFIKYPDIVQSQVIITTQIPPQKEYAKTSGVDTPKNRAVSLIIKFTANDTKKIYLEVQDQSGFGSLKRAA